MLPLEYLLPLRAVNITLQFSDSANLRLYHQPALTAWLRHLVGEVSHYEQYIALDAPESGRIAYQAGDCYRFTLFALNGGERLLQHILNCLLDLPNNVKRRDEKMPFRDNLLFQQATDFWEDYPILSVEELSLYTLERLGQETELWSQHTECWINWYSPVRLLRPKLSRGRGENKFCRHRSQLDFASLNNRVYDTLAELLRFRADNVPARYTDHSARLLMADMFWIDYSYYNEHGKENPMGGLLGRLVLDTTDMPVEQWTYWVLGQYIGIGQRRAFGWGRYQLESSESGYTARRCSAVSSLLELACQPDNLQLAYNVLHEGEGDIEDVIAHLSQLGADLLHKRYQIPPLREQTVPNADGTTRLLQVPPPLDRVMQRAVAQVITPSLDTLMYSGNLGLRRARSPHSAVKMIQKAYQEGYRWVFELEVENSGENIQWPKLFTRLLAFFGEDSVSDVIMAWMSAPLEYQEHLMRREMGLPQGSPLSPLLANMMLDDFDNNLVQAGLRLVRFAHHFLVLTRTEKQAEAARKVVIATLVKEQLKINEAKMRAQSFAQGFRYLDYFFVNNLVFDIGGEHAPKIPYLVCYDVSNDNVRDRIAKVLLKYGNRVQYSVFEVVLRSQAELQKLSEKLRAVADEETNIRLYRLCDNCRHAAHNLDGEPIIEMPAVVII